MHAIFLQIHMKNEVIRIITFQILLLITSLNYSLAESDLSTISGYIYDKETGVPLNRANVYLSGTQFGVSTNDQGRFKIDSVPSGSFELVVSIVGYETWIRAIIVREGKDSFYTIRLNPLIYETSPIVVEAKDPRAWKENLKIFKKMFLGKSSVAKECIIENETDLDFYWENGNRFYAKAKKPLVLINRALGYKIFCVLMSFKWDKSEREWRWIIKPWFIELEPENNMQLEILRQNRSETHLNSINQFFYSLVNQNINEDNYELYITKVTSNRFNKTKPLWQYPIIPDSLIQPGISPNKTIVTFKDYLKVVNKNQITMKNKNNLNFNRTVLSKGYQVSWIKLNEEKVTIDKNGYPQELYPYVCYGYWGALGVADLLPRYYKSISDD